LRTKPLEDDNRGITWAGKKLMGEAEAEWKAMDLVTAASVMQVVK